MIRPGGVASFDHSVSVARQGSRREVGHPHRFPRWAGKSRGDRKGRWQLRALAPLLRSGRRFDSLRFQPETLALIVSPTR